MAEQKTDRVLLIVGVILVVAITGFIIASVIIPPLPNEPAEKEVKISPTGNSAEKSPCCKSIPQCSSGCGAAKSGGNQG